MLAAMPRASGEGNDELEAAPGLSDADRPIIRALQEDGRRSFARIAADIGSSERSVRNRVKELRDDGVIQITAIADPELLGYGVIALLGVRTDPSRSLSQIASELSGLPGAFYVMAVAGRYNVLVEISCADLDELLSHPRQRAGGAAGDRRRRGPSVPAAALPGSGIRLGPARRPEPEGRAGRLRRGRPRDHYAAQR